MTRSTEISRGTKIEVVVGEIGPDDVVSIVLITVPTHDIGIARAVHAEFAGASDLQIEQPRTSRVTRVGHVHLDRGEHGAAAVPRVGESRERNRHRGTNRL